MAATLGDHMDWHALVQKGGFMAGAEVMEAGPELA